MRLRNRRGVLPPEAPQPTVVGQVEVDAPPVVPWSVEQLNALGPVTGLSHRTFVPIVRSSLPDNSVGDVTNT